MRFLLDENVHHGLLRFLSASGHDGALSPKGLANGAVFTAALSANRALLTHDKDFAERPPVVDHPGVILLRLPPEALAVLIAALQRLLAQVSSPEWFANRLFVVFPDRHDEFPFRAEIISV